MSDFNLIGYLVFNVWVLFTHYEKK